MFYVFILLLIGSFIRERQKLFKEKRNLALFLLFSLAGILLGLIHNISPYIPSIAMRLEEFMK